MTDRYRLYGVSPALLQLPIAALLAACSPSAPEAGPENEARNVAAAPAAPAPTGDERLVVAFGDSLFAGYGLEQDEGLVPALERALRTDGINARVVSAAVSGDTSAAGLQRLAFALDGLPRKPDLVLVGLGGNDMLRGLPPEQTRENLVAILDVLKARGIPAMLSGMCGSPNMGKDYIAAFDRIYPDLAAEYDVPLYPFTLDGVIGDRALMLPDGIHPNPEGVEVIVRGVAPVVEKALSDEGRR